MQSDTTEPPVLTKSITSLEDLDAFIASQTFDDLVSFVLRLGDSVKGIKTTDASIICSEVLKILLE